jgi:hypothetical protein
MQPEYSMRCLVLFAVSLALAAQNPRFDVQSRLVLVPVTVTGAKGRTIDGLDTNDFVVLDNGRPQKVTVDTMATGVAPLALVIAIQASGISKAVLEKVHRIGAMIQPLVTGERGCAGVVAFSERIVWLQDCTNDEDALARALEQVRPGAGKSARMLDAVYESIERLRKRPNSRRVLLLISESRDRGSETALDQVAMAVQASGVTAYAATYSAFNTAFTSKHRPPLEGASGHADLTYTDDLKYLPRYASYDMKSRSRESALPLLVSSSMLVPPPLTARCIRDNATVMPVVPLKWHDEGYYAGWFGISPIGWQMGRYWLPRRLT